MFGLGAKGVSRYYISVLLSVVQIFCVHHLSASGFGSSQNQGDPERNLVVLFILNGPQDMRRPDHWLTATPTERTDPARPDVPLEELFSLCSLTYVCLAEHIEQDIGVEEGLTAGHEAPYGGLKRDRPPSEVHAQQSEGIAPLPIAHGFPAIRRPVKGPEPEH